MVCEEGAYHELKRDGREVGSGNWREGGRDRGEQELYTFLRIRRVIPFVRH